MTDVRLLKVLVASPGDLSNEREMITQVFGAWNSQNAEEYRLVFLPVLWEQHAYSELLPNQGVQDILNNQLAAGCDMLVGMFWGRLGTPTDKYPSGTAEEIETFLEAGKPVMLYFSNAAARLAGVSPGQLARVEKFKRQMQKRGLAFEFDGAAQFREMVSRHLTALARRRRHDEINRFIEDPRVEKFRWEALDRDTRSALYARFLELSPRHNMPLTIPAPFSLQEDLEARRPLRLDVLRRLLGAFGFPSDDIVLPADRERLGRVQRLNKPLAAEITRAVENGPAGDQLEAALAMYDYLADSAGRPASAADQDGCDVVLVPGARRGHTYRVDMALGIAQRSGAAIVLSGGHPSYDPLQPLGIGEAEAMDYYLQSRMIDASVTVLRESRARTTSETLLHIWPDLVALAVEKSGPLGVIAVTSPYHMQRLMLLCDATYAGKTHVVGWVKGVLATSSFDRNVFLSPKFEPERRRYGIGVYVQEMFKLYGGRVTGEF